MTTRKHANNVDTTLASGISNVATSMTLTSATGFPAIGAGETWRATITDGVNYEIVECTDDNSSPVMTITRAMEGTTAQTWSAGALVVIMGTADSFDRKWDKAETSASGLGILDTDGALAANSDAKVPSQKAVKTYTDSIYGFKTIVVSGQSDVVADSATDTLTLAAGSNITLTTNASTDTVTIAASGGGSSRDRDATTSITTSGGTTTLTSSSTFQQRFTGSTTGDICKMPVTSTLTAGYQYRLINDSTVSVAVQSSGANAILSIPAGCAVLMTCADTAVTTAAGWTYALQGKLGGVYYPMQTVTGNTTLTASSPYITYYEDSGAVNNTMPVASRLVNGQSWCWINNKSSGDVTIYASDNTTVLLVLPIGYKAEFICKDNTGGTGATPWIYTVSPINALVNQVVSSVITAGAIASNTLTNLTSISLTAGEWDVWGAIRSVPAAGTTQSSIVGAINTVSATLPDVYASGPAFNAGVAAGLTIPYTRLSLTSTTTVYLVAYDVYAVSTLTMNGNIYARRRALK